MKESEFKTMLEFYHDLGVIFYYGGLATLDVLLRNTVILRPQWLIDTFQKILTAKEPNEVRNTIEKKNTFSLSNSK